MHLVKAGTKAADARSQCDDVKRQGVVTVDTAQVTCRWCLWATVRLVRVTEAQLLARLYELEPNASTLTGRVTS